MGSVSGILIAESLLRDRPLEGISLVARKISRSDAGDPIVGQPLTWTFIEFEVDESELDKLMDGLSDSLDPAGGWYCDFRTSRETFVVFGGRVFRYPRGEPEGRASAEAYGRSVGVPDAQLDWPE